MVALLVVAVVFFVTADRHKAVLEAESSMS